MKIIKIIKIIVVIGLFYNISFANTILNIGYDLSGTNLLSKKDMKVATDILLKKILENLDVKTNYKYYYNPKEIAKDMNTGKLDYVSVSPLNIVKYFNLDNLDKAFGQGSNDMNDYNLIIISRSDLNIKSNKELANKKILMDTKNNLHSLYINNLFLKYIGNKKANTIYSRSYQKSILDLFFKKADVAIVTQKSYDISVELNPQIAKKVSILRKTNIKDVQLGFFRKSLDEKLKRSMGKAGQELNFSDDGKQLLTLYKTEKIVETNMEILIPIKELLNNYKKLKKSKGIK